jgi:hypothetical protein
MAKLRLDLEALVVESFDTVAVAAGRGTVAAYQIADEPRLSQSNCHDCNYTILGTCLSCNEPVCTIASKTECPSCYNSCGDCGPTCACPVEPAPSPVPLIRA